ncbi:alpha/beta fold hydrolase [Rheinheimera baltica]|uniref:esterase/lipase family protein n=1 Tax=Rheinheimera baltica TaxID=67576 RepID=UPI00273E43C9|nr:alpha/beta fold hydrolase [Rheinheimera baltica]MDP5144115.1 alpha/beta fold hydrolase [Rheinheimera baltica]MDP5148935.1 alpha/beta fold hydrolase [Rheinheimera baltica]
MRVILSAFVLLMSFNTVAKDCVVLLHGLARSASAMETMQQALDAAGYHSVNVDYPSREHAIEVLAPMAIAPALAQCRAKQSRVIHFVTHSMGGILLRQYTQDNVIADLGRVVMMGPPNQGSQVVDNLKDVPGFEAFNGPAGMQLGTGAQDIPKQLGPVSFELGVIAGTSSINLILSTFLPNPDDGKVSVENTKVQGMCALVTVDVSHPFLMKRQKVIDQVLHFLSSGSFLGDNAQQFACPAQIKPKLG